MRTPHDAVGFGGQRHRIIAGPVDSLRSETVAGINQIVRAVRRARRAGEATRERTR